MQFDALPFSSSLSDYELQAAKLNIARDDLARCYAFTDWAALENFVRNLATAFTFESAVEAIVAGDRGALESLLAANPDLAQSRSSRRHRATLLHYIAANGVEDYRQKTPPNAVEIAQTLLAAGAEADAAASMYGGDATTLAMLVSSSPPAKAGVQVALAETLIDGGASVEGTLTIALAFGHLAAAEALVRRGAPIDNLAAAAGLGRIDLAQRLLPGGDPEMRHRALAFAAQHGHEDVVRLLLDAGENPARYNPAGAHAHSTPLHQAALAGHDGVVRLLVERGAPLTARDTVHRATPLDWAVHAGQTRTADFLRARGEGC